MNILLVVPFKADLPLLTAEAEALVNLLNPREILIGSGVTEDRLSMAIESAVSGDGPFDGIWLATHMSDRAVELSDGTISRDTLVQYLDRAGVHWAVLNGCESEGMAAGIAAIGIDVLVAAMTDAGTGIGDRDALRVARLVASELRDNGGDLQSAYDSIPHISNKHRFFPASHTARAYNSNSEGYSERNNASLARLEEKVDNLSRKVDEMAVALEKRPTKEAMFTVLFLWGIVVLILAGVFYQLTIRGFLV
jgi:hypothetical protein